MGSSPVRSFGRPEEKPAEQAAVILPPVVMPPVQIPLVLMVDPTALAAAAAEIQAMVCGAVRGGFAEAMQGLPTDEPQPAPGGPAAPPAGS